MSSFDQEQAQASLQHDSTAFLYFAISVCVAMGSALLTLIMRGIWQWRNKTAFDGLKNQGLYLEKIKATRQYYSLQKQLRNNRHKILFLAVCITASIYCWCSLEANTQLRGFDPYQIMNLPSDATHEQIKKSFRTLMQIHMPDKNHDTSPHKFLQVMKAYKCLTDPKVRESCLKYNNPDGEPIYRVGIGLPTLTGLTQESSLLAAALMVLGLITVVPWLVGTWIAGRGQQDEDGLYYSDYYALSRVVNPGLGFLGCCVAVGIMRDLDTVYGKQKLSQEEGQKMRALLIGEGQIDAELVGRLTSEQLYRIRQIKEAIGKDKMDSNLAAVLPQLCEKLLKFSLNYADRRNKFLSLPGGQKMPLAWYGLIPARRCIDFCLKVFNSCQDQSPIKQKALSEIMRAQALNCDENLLQGLYAKFQKAKHVAPTTQAQRDREILYDWLMNLPLIRLGARLVLEDQQAKEIQSTDVTYLQITADKARATDNYVQNPCFPIMCEQRYIVLVSSNSDLIWHQVFSFGHRTSIQHRVKMRRLGRGLLQLQVRLISLNYSYINAMKQIRVEVFGKLSARPSIVHQEDEHVGEVGKSFFEKFVLLDQGASNSDLQLSDTQSGQDDQGGKQHMRNIKLESGHIKQLGDSGKMGRKLRKRLKKGEVHSL